MSSLAVLNCKSSKLKGEGPYTGEELYWASASFRAQVIFAREFYDSYIIISAGHGIVYPDKRIYTPYNKTIWRGTNWDGSNEGFRMSREETCQWRDSIIESSIFDKYDEIDFHVSWYYGAWFSDKNSPLSLLKKKHPQTIFRYIKQPQSLTGPIYLYPKLAELWRTGNRDSSILAMVQDRKPVADEFVVHWIQDNPHGSLKQFRVTTGKSVGDSRFRRLKNAISSSQLHEE